MDRSLRTVLTMLATARLTRLLVADKVTEPIRKRVIDRYGDDSMQAYIAHCPWCVSMYLAPVIVAVARSDSRAVRFGLEALAASHVTGLLAEMVTD